MTMQELIERLEKATGADRELDIAIFEAAVAVPNVGQMIGVEPRQWDPKYTPLLVPHPKWGFSPAVPADAERYTSSIDAALTLVPEGLSASVTKHSDGTGAAEIWRYAVEKFAYRIPGLTSDNLRARNGTFDHQRVVAKTPAIAICIASLRARLALASDGEKE